MSNFEKPDLIQKSELLDLLREDYSSTSTFISEFVAQFSKSELLTPKEKDEFRITNTSFNEDLSSSTTGSTTDKTYLEKLDHLKPDFYKHLLIFFSESMITHNYWNYSFSKVVSPFMAQITNLTQILYKKSELFFNKRVYSYSEKGPSNTSFLSTLFAESAEATYKVHQKGQELLESHSVFIDSQIIADIKKPELNENLSKALGFKQRTSSLRVLELNHALEISTFTAHLEFLHRALEGLISEISENSESFSKKTCLSDLFAFQICIKSLKEYSSVDKKSLAMSEIVRLQFLKDFRSATKALASLSILIETQVAPSTITDTPRKTYTSHDEARLSLDLIQRGHSVEQSIQISAKFLTYLKRYEINAEDAIETEIKNIHSDLTKDHVKSLFGKKLSDTLTPSELAEKQDSTRLLKRIEEFLSKCETQKMTIAILLAVIFQSCGVKTLPVSDIQDKRPSIPYHKKAESKDTNDD